MKHVRRPPAFHPDPDGWIIILIGCVIPIAIGLAGLLYEALVH